MKIKIHSKDIAFGGVGIYAISLLKENDRFKTIKIESEVYLK